jgi:hypothetical protein
MIGDYLKHKEIGTYVDTNIDNNDFKIIISKVDDIFYKITENQSKKKKNKIELEKYLIFYTFANVNIFYLAVVLKGSLYSQQENLVYELFEDVENRGIKKLVNESGELTLVGKQNLKFCIELDQETNRKNNEKNSDDNYISKKNEKDMAKFSLINNELNDIQDNVKESMKNILTNVNDMQDLDDKSAKIKDISEKFQKDSYMLEKKLRKRKCIHRILLICFLMMILGVIFYFIFK